MVAVGDERQRHDPGVEPAAADFDGKRCALPRVGDAPEHARARAQPSLRAVANVTHVDVLKVDVEGFEVRVFAGALRLLLASHPPVIVFEFSDWAEARAPGAQPGDAQRFLMAHGYSVWTLTDYSRRRAALRAPITTGEAMLVADRRPRM